MRSLSTFVTLFVVLCVTSNNINVVESFVVAPYTSSCCKKAASAPRPRLLLSDSINHNNGDFNDFHNEPIPKRLHKQQNILSKIFQNPFKGKRNSRLVGVVLATLVWWKGPQLDVFANNNHNRNVAHAQSQAAPLDSKSAVSTTKKTGGSSKLVTGTGIVLVAAGAGVVVGKVLKKGQQQGTNGSSIDGIDSDTTRTIGLTRTSSGLTDTSIVADDKQQRETGEEAESAQKNKKEQEKAQAQVATMIDRVQKAQRRAEQVLEEKVEETKTPPPPIIAAPAAKSVEPPVPAAAAVIAAPAPVVAAPVVTVPAPVVPAPVVPVVAKKIQLERTPAPPAAKKTSPPKNGRSIANARKQPKAPSDEEKLKMKYGAIPSVEERAFQILVDLAMVETTDTKGSSKPKP